MNKRKIFWGLSKGKTLWYNIRFHVKNKFRGLFLLHKGSVVIVDKTAKVCGTGKLSLNANCLKRNKRSTILRMDKGSEISITGSFSFYYGSDIILFENACLQLGSGFCNSDVKTE